MSRNIIDIFAKGNQELFHSAFLAWLMIDGESHGLGKRFRSGILSRLPVALGYDVNGEYDVHTEFSSGRLRFDIMLRPIGVANERKGLVFENKIKSFGTSLQLEQYKNEGYDVVALALLPETLDDETKQHYPVITYNVIRDILKDASLLSENPYQFVVGEYRDFLTQTLDCYSAIADYGRDALTPDGFFERLRHAAKDVKFSDNDIRTFDYFYYYALAEFIKQSAPDLAFGVDFYDRGVNTRWIFAKNMQGPPFMEAIIYHPLQTPGWTLQSPFLQIANSDSLHIAPRLEVWLDPSSLVQKRNASEVVGKLMLGTWTSEFKKSIKELSPYRTTLKPRPRAQRNFHCEDVLVSDLPFSRMTERIRAMMQLIFDRNVPAERN
jgi:hypothetical protein